MHTWTRGICVLLVILFGTVPSAATESEKNRLPVFMHLHGKGLASGWDGRLVFDAKYLGSVGGKFKYGWTVQVVRPENIGSSGNPYADLQNVTDLFSPSVVFDWDVNSPGYPASPSNADGRLHLAVYPDPGFVENPYRSDALGTPSIGGAYETYQIQIIGKYDNVLSSTIPISDQEKLMGRHRIQVVVKNPRTAAAAIESANVLSEARLLKTGTNIMHGYEPTVSMDGRLLIWHGHPSNDLRLRFVMYSYNPDPHALDGYPASVEDTGWSFPRTVSAMYFEHGPGATVETMLPDGALFSDQYPIARQPLSVYALENGLSGLITLDENKPIPGAYPWLSWDASELFFPIMPNFYSALRSGFAVIGARTHWRLEHVDGPINWTRGNVTESVTNWPGTTTGNDLLAAYDSLTAQLHPNSLHHKLDFEAIQLAPLGLGHSMWSSSPEDPGAAIPYFGGRDTYAMLASHSGRYFEVPLFRVRDGRFIASFPFNEALRLDVDTAQQLVQSRNGIPGYPELARDAVTYQEKATLDVSGHGLVGTLENGAAFPYDYNGAKAEWQNNQVLLDYTEGLKGNSIYFPRGSYVGTALESNLVRSMAGQSGWAFSFWIKALEDLTASQFGLLNLGSHLIYLGNWASTIQFGVRNETTAELLAAVHLFPAAEVLTPTSGWRHVAMSYHRGRLSIYLDGTWVKDEAISDEVAIYLESALSSGGNKSLKIGPYSLSGSGPNAVLMMDDFDLLNSPLDRRTLSRLAFSGQLAEPNPDSATVDLGRQLFFDTRLSTNQRFSCATCHRPEASYGDDTATSPGIYGRSGSRNTPALLGSPPGHSKMVTASLPDSEIQWRLPLSGEAEMGSPIDVVLSRLNLDPDLVQEMQTVLGGPPSAANVGKALAAYLDSLALPADLEHPDILDHPGRQLFFGRARCANCHSGSRLSDGHLHKLGLTSDPGRQLESGLAEDFGKFRTAQLIGLADSAPYFHDGSASTLMDVVEAYNQGFVDNPVRSPDLRPLGLTSAEISELVDFLAQIPAVADVPSPPTLGNHISNYGVGCVARDCFWMVVEGGLPANVIVEVRDVDSGNVIQPIFPTIVPNGDSTELRGQLSGSVLNTFQETGVLLNIRYANGNGRVIRSGPRFVRSAPTWPGPATAPSISAAGTGCVERDCIWIVPNGLDANTIVEVSHPETGEVVALYSGANNRIWGYLGANIFLADQEDELEDVDVVTLRVDPMLWPVFATSGLKVRLINRHFGNNPNSQSNYRVVVSPSLAGS